MRDDEKPEKFMAIKPFRASWDLRSSTGNSRGMVPGRTNGQTPRRMGLIFANSQTFNAVSAGKVSSPGIFIQVISKRYILTY
jgi:hypothetical protein